MAKEAEFEKIESHVCFDGVQARYAHAAKVLDCRMHFSIFLPSIAEKQKVPVIYWLSGLTCTDENFVHKAGAQRYAEEHGVAIVCPDTSPRGDHVPDDPEEAWDLGKGAGFYLNATEKPWHHHYRMYDYVTEELPALINDHFAVDIERCSIMGHSMGGHGALTIALQNTARYACVSAFAPIVAPMQVPWGEKAFSNYLGENRDDWAQYDTVELIRKAEFQLPMRVDQGLADNFLEQQLKPELLEKVCEEQEYPLILNRYSNYDHSYFFIATFIGSHVEFHAKHLHNE